MPWPKVTAARNQEVWLQEGERAPFSSGLFPPRQACACQRLLENLLKRKLLGHSPRVSVAPYSGCGGGVCILKSSLSSTEAGCLLLGAFSKSQSGLPPNFLFIRRNGRSGGGMAGGPHQRGGSPCVWGGRGGATLTELQPGVFSTTW